ADASGPLLAVACETRFLVLLTRPAPAREYEQCDPDWPHPVPFVVATHLLSLARVLCHEPAKMPVQQTADSYGFVDDEFLLHRSPHNPDRSHALRRNDKD